MTPIQRFGWRENTVNAGLNLAATVRIATAERYRFDSSSSADVLRTHFLP